jgi:uncharacterized membrane protein YqaE (UPF0057 family)
MKKLDQTLPESRETASSWFLEFLMAILMPPVAVLMNRGPGRKVLITILLTLLGFIPGIAYAFYVLLSGIEDKENSAID